MREASFALEEAPLFRSLTPDEATFLRERVHLRTFKPDARLLEEGQDSPGLYVIKSGLVAVIVQCDGGLERELARFGKGECVGDMAVMTCEPCSATVRAITDTEAWFIERGDFVDLVNRCPGLWRNLGHILSQRLVRTSHRLTSESSTKTVALAAACPDEQAAALAVAIVASLARQTGKRTLLVDGRVGPVHPVSDFVPGKPAPSLSEVLHDRSLLGEHEAPPDRANGLWGARVGALCCEDGSRPSEEEILTALEWLRPCYDHILLLLSGLPTESRSPLLDGVRSIVAMVADGDAGGALPWLDRLCRCPEARGKVEVAVVSGRPPAPSTKHSVEERVGRRVRWLPDDGGLLHRMLREKALLAEARPKSPFSRGLDGLARHIGGMEVGLALGAGAAKGFAHIGVLRVLEENAVPIDYVAGSSIGAIVGGLYAGGASFAEIQRRLQGSDRKVIRWTLPFTAIWSDAGLRQVLRDPGPTVQFHELPIPFAAVATDLGTGREVVLQSGLVWRAVQASVSIPGMFPPTFIGGRYLVDGGLVNPVPSRTVRAMGADIVVAVDLMTPAVRTEGTSGLRRGLAGRQGRRAPNLVEILWRSNEIMQGEITARSAATADVTIQPKVGRSRWSDFSRRGQSFIAAGEEAARDVLPELRCLLPFLIPSSSPGGSGQ